MAGRPHAERGCYDAPSSVAFRAANMVSMSETITSKATANVPDAVGRFGDFGGRYVPETLTRALDELAAEYEKARQDAEFQAEFGELLKHYVGRPSPLYLAKRLT